MEIPMLRKLLLVPLTALAITACPVLAEPATDTAVQSETTPFEQVLLQAAQGNRDAAYQVGTAYWQGKTVPQDMEQAVHWWTEAAEKGHPIAQFLLGSAYHDGNGIAKDARKSVQWYRKSARQSYPPAQYYLGQSLFNGEGIKADTAQAISWWKKAASQ